MRKIFLTLAFMFCICYSENSYSVLNCIGLMSLPLVCSSADGCEGVTVYMICMGGCSNASCQSNYGLCCDTPYTSKSLYPYGDDSPCSKFGCMEIVTPNPENATNNERYRHGSLQEFVLGEVFIPDTCSGSYRLIDRRISPPKIKGEG
jgi:hypothetical protein